MQRFRIAAVGHVLADIAHRHAVDHLARAGGKHQRFFLIVNGKIRVRKTCAGLHLVFARAEDQIIAARRDHRILGEHPLQGFFRVVAEGEMGQPDILRAAVIKLHPVGKLVVLVAQAGSRRGHDFINQQHARLHGVVGHVFRVPRLAVGIARTVGVGFHENAIVAPRVGLVRIERRNAYAVDGNAGRVV